MPPLPHTRNLTGRPLPQVDGSLTRFSERFPKLHTLCLFRNGFSALPEILAALRQLPKLRELDLDGNPCAHSSGYKHHIVRALGRLTTLDGACRLFLPFDLPPRNHSFQIL